MFIRSELPEDVEPIRAVLRAAFRRSDGGGGPDGGGRDSGGRDSGGRDGAPDPPEVALVDDLRADPQAWLPGFSMVAVEGDRVIGHVLLTRMPVGGAPSLCLAPLAVLPELQGQGVGTRLMDRAIGEARAAGDTLVVVLGDPSFYGRFGFQGAADLGFLGPYGLGPAFQVLPLATDHPRGDAVYRPAFAHV